MAFRSADVEWQGNVQSGHGHIKLASGAFEGDYSLSTRMDGRAETNPEELLASAHAGCFTMAFSMALGAAGHEPTRIHTTAQVRLSQRGGEFIIPRIDLKTEAVVPGIAAAAFQEIATRAERSCPVSKALAGTEIHLEASLLDA